MATIAGVKITDLYKSFFVDGREIPVLRGLNLELPGEGIAVVVGKSGCGKTTLLRTLGGFESIDSGTIERSHGDRIGMVFQEPRLMPWLNTWKNITFGQKHIDVAAIQELIATVGLMGFEKAYPDQLSGGMQQRVSLARALAHHSDLILMDEPFAALDYFTRETMQNELIRINKISKRSIIFVTHSIDEALLLGQQIVILGEGMVKKIYDLSQFHSDRNILSPPFLETKKSILENVQ